MGGWGASGTASCGGASPRRTPACEASGPLSNCRWVGGRKFQCLLVLLQVLPPGCATRCCVADQALAVCTAPVGMKPYTSCGCLSPLCGSQNQAAATILVTWQSALRAAQKHQTAGLRLDCCNLHHSGLACRGLVTFCLHGLQSSPMHMVVRLRAARLPPSSVLPAHGPAAVPYPAHCPA